MRLVSLLRPVHAARRQPTDEGGNAPFGTLPFINYFSRRSFLLLIVFFDVRGGALCVRLSSPLFSSLCISMARTNGWMRNRRGLVATSFSNSMGDVNGGGGRNGMCVCVCVRVEDLSLQSKVPTRYTPLVGMRVVSVVVLWT